MRAHGRHSNKRLIAPAAGAMEMANFPVAFAQSSTAVDAAIVDFVVLADVDVLVETRMKVEDVVAVRGVEASFDAAMEMAFPGKRAQIVMTLGAILEDIESLERLVGQRFVAAQIEVSVFGQKPQRFVR